MADTNTPDRNTNPIGVAFTVILGLVALPFVLLARPLRALGLGQLVRGAYVEGNLLYLSDPAHSDRIAYREIDVDPRLTKQAEVTNQVRVLVGAEDWTGLADMMADLDRTRAAAPSGSRLIYTALDAITDCFAQGYYEPNVCMPFPAAAIDAERIDEFEAIAAKYPEHYCLAAIASHFRLQNAWEYRGGVYADDIYEDDWVAAGKCAAHSAETLAPYVMREPDSPLIAMLEFSQLPFDPAAGRSIHTLYRTWSDLDPDNQYAHKMYAYYLQPKWYGEEEYFDQYLRKAALENRAAGGAAGYASAYLFITEDDRFAVYDMDGDLFAEGVIDLAKLSDNDPEVVARLVQAVHVLEQFNIPRKRISSDQIEALEALKAILIQTRDTLLREHLCAIVPQAWDGGTKAALDYLSLALQAELSTSATFVLDESGLRVCSDSQ